MPAESHVSDNNAPSAPENLADQDLASWLGACFTARHQVAYLHSGYLCKVVNLDEAGTQLHSADPGRTAKKSLEKLAGRNLLYQLDLPQQVLQEAVVANLDWKFAPLSKSGINSLIAKRDGLLGRTIGRGPAISDRTAQKVWSDAGGRCMFEGCSEDLTEVPLWQAPARVGYLAHIIASDPAGPRGNQADSHRLSNDPENIMLMCDGHHRLIDSFAPDKYTADVLNEMRQSHRDTVRHYLDSLAFPRTRAVTLHANLAQVPTYFHDSELIEAVLATRRAMLPNVLHCIRRKSHRDDRHTPGFWVQYLREHEMDIRRFIGEFSSSSGGVTGNVSIFPLHHIPTLVLAGRIMGEAQSIQVFQYNKNRRSWAWDSKTIPKPAGTFQFNSLSTERVSEVFLSLELTATVDEQALPAELRTELNAGRIPWIRITTPNPGFDCIAHPDDLDQFVTVARRVVDHVQDVMRARKVHLVAISPAGSVFRFGQTLQAGHHPEYVVYDRSGREFPFAPAFSITGHAVSATDGTTTHTIPLR